MTPRLIKDFATAGNATLTIRSVRTNVRFTYKVTTPKDQEPGKPPIWFVKVMDGPDNERSYSYLGNIRHDLTYDHGRKSRIRVDDPRELAFNWMWNRMVRPERADLMEKMEVWHEGRCGRCGRKLTVPASIESGFGPECRGERSRQHAVADER